MRTFPIFTIFCLGFFSGLPLLLTNSTLQAWLTQSGVTLTNIGLLSLVGLPYIFKFLWAPFIDRFQLPFWGRRQGWMACMQLLIAASLLLLSFLYPASQLKIVGLIAFAIAFFSATQDIVINAYQVEMLKPEERGAGVSAQVMGYRIAMLISSGIAFIIANYVGFKVLYQLMALLMLLGVVITYYAPRYPADRTPRTIKEAVITPLIEFLSRENALVILLFIFLYKMGASFTTALSSTFFLRDLSFSLATVGAIGKTLGFAATLMGALLGGLLFKKLGLFRSLFYMGLSQAFATLFYLACAIAGHNITLLAVTVIAENVTSGMSTIAFLALIMSLCHREYTATQFALLSALDSVGRVLVGPLAGWMVTQIGWANFYGFAFMCSFPALFILLYLKNHSCITNYTLCYEG